MTSPGGLPVEHALRVAFALPDDLEAQLRAAVWGADVFPLDPHGDRLADADALVIDPEHLDDAQRALLTARILETVAPYVFFTVATPAALEAVVALETLSPLQVIIAGSGDEGAQLRAAILDASRRASSAVLRHRLSMLLPALPPNLQGALDLVLRKPERFFDAVDVARHSGLSRRHVDRVLQVNGLAPAKQWVIAARVWHAVQLQRRKHMPFAEVARRLGYADAKALRRHRASVLGASCEAGTPGDTPGDTPSDTPDIALDHVVAFLRATD